MAPIGMIQETQKKTEISGVVGKIVKKRIFFSVFLKIMKIPKAKKKADGKKKSLKCWFFVHFW